MAPMESTRGYDLLLSAAERLYGARGLDAVSTRDILSAARQKNQSALQYHFGSREGLLLALLSDRFKRIDTRRLALLAARSNSSAPSDLTTLLHATAAPLAEDVETREGGPEFVQLLAQLIHRPGIDVVALMSEGHYSGLQRIVVELQPHLRHLAPEIRVLRSRMLLMLIVGTIAQWVHYHRNRIPLGEMVKDLIQAGCELVRQPSAITLTRATKQG